MERHRNSAIKTFEAPLLSYKHEDNLKDIAAALNLDDTGTIPDLVAQIQEDMDRHPNLAENPRFTAPYSTHHARKRRMVNPNPLPQASSSHPNLLSGAGQDVIDERNDIIDPLLLV